ncbi:MAG: hypothetical protein LBJ75_01540 [Puniceicoccales bacterium]|nr:hypothetical protein [Puniceicoccales bacterium]
MRPEVAVAPAPTVVPAMGKCEITPPAKEIASSVSANGPTETAAPTQSFLARAMLRHVKFKAREKEYVADVSREIGKGIVEVAKKGVDAAKELVDKQVGNFFTAANDYRKAHPDAHNSIQNTEQVFSALGVSMDIGQVIAGAAVGAEAGGVAGAVSGAVATGTKIAGTRYIVEKAISKGEDSFVNLAMKYAVGDEQRAEFKETAKFIYSTAGLGASAAGMIKGNFHVASKLKTTVLSSRTLGLEKGYSRLDLGRKFEDHVAATKYVPADRLPPKFKTFDFFDKKDGVAISVKTMDTRTDRLRTNPNEIGEGIRRYIEKTLDFEEYKLSGTLITRDMIKGRKLELGIPTETTPIQRQHILEAIERGKSSGVEVIITEIEY